MKIAYFINQYPKVSHSFIRREILALERLGFVVQRIALRGWADEVVDAEDILERERTYYVLQGGLRRLLLSVVKALYAQPVLFFKALKLALKMSRHADRSWPYHLIYLAEACHIVSRMNEFGAQHIHAHFGTNSAEVVMLAHELGGPPYSFTVHGPDEFDKPEFIGLAEKIRRASFVVAISSFGRSQLYRWIEQPYWHKVKVVHCGLEESFYKSHDRSLPTIPRLVCVGRLCEQKGQLLLIEAMRILAENGMIFELVLAGDGEMRADVEKLIDRYKLNDRVRISGWISGSQVREEILASQALVLPSFAEGLPVVIMEAMALRRPVLTTYVAGIPELVLNQENGWLFPAGDVEALAKAMRACLEMPREQLAQMGECARVRVLERHAIDLEAAKLAQLFNEAGRLNRLVTPV